MHKSKNTWQDHTCEATASSRLELAAGRNAHLLTRRTAARSHRLDRLDDLHSLGHLSKDTVLAVEEGCVTRADEELRSVRVGARVGHREAAGPAVAKVKILVLELVAVDRLAAGTVLVGEIAALAHEA